MAKTKLPDPLGRRHLIERDLAPAQALKYAEAYREEGRAVEAADFFAKADAAEPLEELRREAVGSGDVFLLRVVAKAITLVRIAMTRQIQRQHSEPRFGQRCDILAPGDHGGPHPVHQHHRRSLAGLNVPDVNASNRDCLKFRNLHSASLGLTRQ